MRHKLVIPDLELFFIINSNNLSVSGTWLLLVDVGITVLLLNFDLHWTKH